MKQHRKGFTLIELLVVVAIIALLISILLPSLSRARELAKRAVCGSNQRSIGQGMHIYSNDNDEWFPHHYFRAQITPGSYGNPTVHNVQWVGELGGGTVDYATEIKVQPGGSGTAPGDQNNHPSRSLFLLVAGGQSTVGLFTCPSSSDSEDDLRNRGVGGASNEQAAIPGKNRFDFKGYNNLSYGYQLPFSSIARPNQNLSPQHPLTADKGPYYTAGNTDTGTGATIDALNTAVDQPQSSDFDGANTLQEILRISNEDWAEFNSRNHSGEGQNIMFVDGHVDFEKRPIAGVNQDNIYTLIDGTGDDSSLFGSVPKQNQKRGPSVNTDSYLVP